MTMLRPATRPGPWSALLVGASCLALAGCGGSDDAADSTAAAPTVTTTVGERGAALYATHCAMCHGREGRGDGGMAAMLDPPPRGLIDEPWRYLDTSTPQRLRSSMAELLLAGMPEQKMPGLAGRVSDDEVDQIVDFVLSLRE